MRRFLTASLITACASMSMASFTFLPNAFESVEGDGANKALTQSIGQSRRYQFVVDASRLLTIAPGSQITGLSWRADIQGANPAIWPPTPATFSSFNITMGAAANTAATASTTFASNHLGSQTTVYSGSYTIPMNSYVNSGGSGPNPWGPELVLQTPFAYNGGDLCIEFAHSGTDIASSLFHDAALDNPNNGVRAIGANTSSATAGSITSFTVTRLTVAPVPEPGAWIPLLSGVALVGLQSLRSRRETSRMPE